MAYNYLRRADSIRNSTLCINDSNSAYEVSWYENGNLEGWDSYNLLHTYGVWDNVLFATSFGGDAYFGRSTYFPPVAAEDYYILTFQMKVVVADEDRDNITGGKGVTVAIKNIGDGDATNVEYNIDIEGGLIIIPRTDSGNLGTLSPSQSANVTFGPMGIGLGIITPMPKITVTVECAEGLSTEKSADARIILFFVMIQ